MSEQEKTCWDIRVRDVKNYITRFQDFPRNDNKYYRLTEWFKKQKLAYDKGLLDGKELFQFKSLINYKNKLSKGS